VPSNRKNNASSNIYSRPMEARPLLLARGADAGNERS
jgi:hypothetical protein